MKTRFIIDIEHDEPELADRLELGLWEEMHGIAKSQRAYNHKMIVLQVKQQDIPDV